MSIGPPTACNVTFMELLGELDRTRAVARMPAVQAAYARGEAALKAAQSSCAQDPVTVARIVGEMRSARIELAGAAKLAVVGDRWWRKRNG